MSFLWILILFHITLRLWLPRLMARERLRLPRLMARARLRLPRLMARAQPLPPEFAYRMNSRLQDL